MTGFTGFVWKVDSCKKISDFKNIQIPGRGLSDSSHGLFTMLFVTKD